MHFTKSTDRVLQLIRRSKLSVRLISIFLFISLVPGLLLAFTSNRIYEKSIEEKTSQSHRQTLQLYDQNLMLTLEEYSRYITDISISEEIQDFFSASENATDALTIQRQLDNEKLARSVNLRDVILVAPSGKVMWSSGWVGISEQRIAEIAENTYNSPAKDYVSNYRPPYGADYLAVCRKIYDNHFRRTLMGYVVLLINKTVLDKDSFPVSHIGNSSDMFLVNANGILIASQNSDITGSIDTTQFSFDINDLSDEGKLEDDENLIMYTHNSKYDLYLFSVIPNSSLNREIHAAKNLILSVTGILLAVCLVISLLIYLSIITPIRHIITVCQDREQNGSSEMIGDKEPDELGYLSRSIDSMVQKDVIIMQELKKQDEEKRELEIKMLQDQLNPHFLFNTLNTFKWIAGLNGISTLSNGISSLADLLRSTLMTKDELQPLCDEIDLLKSYCTIQDLKYAGQFSVIYSVSDEAMRCIVPRFILQPLVENSILHGIKDNDDLLTIQITCSIEDNALHIIVADDGTGFDPALVFDEETDRFSSVGLSNVDNRLRLHYGDQHRLTIDSSANEGTVCSIVIPIMDIPAL